MKATLKTMLFSGIVSVSSLLADVRPGDAQSPGTDIYLGRLTERAGTLIVADWTNITQRPGYDNQPSFTPDAAAVLYTSQRDGQTDIYRYSVAGRVTDAVTATPESEYSPTVMPEGGRFSTIRVEADSTQRLWSFGLDGADPQLVLSDLAPVGYHTWGDATTLAMFVLGQPPTLYVGDSSTGESEALHGPIGRSLHPIPGRTAISYVDKRERPWQITALDLATGLTARLVSTVGSGEDYAWTPTGRILMGGGSTLYTFDPLTGRGWHPIADLESEGIAGITRLAVSPDGAWIAVVADDPPSADPD